MNTLNKPHLYFKKKDFPLKKTTIHHINSMNNVSVMYYCQEESVFIHHYYIIYGQFFFFA